MQSENLWAHFAVLLQQNCCFQIFALERIRHKRHREVTQVSTSISSLLISNSKVTFAASHSVSFIGVSHAMLRSSLRRRHNSQLCNLNKRPNKSPHADAVVAVHR